MRTALLDVNTRGTLETELLDLAGRVAATRCRWLQLLARFNISTEWRTLGFRSCAHWLRARMGLSRRAADEQLRIARALANLPLVTERFSAGGVSYAKVRAITRAATADDESVWLALAETHTAGQLEAAARLHKHNDDREPREAVLPELHWHWDAQGNLRVRGTFSPEQGAMLLTAVEEMLRSDGVKPAPQKTENAGPSAAERRAGALMTLLQRAHQPTRARRNRNDRGPGAHSRPGPQRRTRETTLRRDRRPRPATESSRTQPRHAGPERRPARPAKSEPTTTRVPEPRSAPTAPTSDGGRPSAIS